MSDHKRRLAQENRKLRAALHKAVTLGRQAQQLLETYQEVAVSSCEVARHMKNLPVTQSEERQRYEDALVRSFDVMGGFTLPNFDWSALEKAGTLDRDT